MEAQPIFINLIYIPLYCANQAGKYLIILNHWGKFELYSMLNINYSQPVYAVRSSYDPENTADMDNISFHCKTNSVGPTDILYRPDAMDKPITA